MKKKLYYIIYFCSLITFMLCACGKSKDLIDDGETHIDYRIEETDDKISEYKDNPTEEWEQIPMVMVNDVLYLATGYEKEVKERRDTFDGEIISQVDRREQPTVNDQSNFGTGYGYQYGTTEGIIEIYMNDKWQIFATEKVIAGDTLILDEN